MTYRILFTDIAASNLQSFPQKDRKLIIKNIEQLAIDPFHKSNVKRLVDFDASAYRLRVGNYRILFDREDNLKIIDVIDIRQRKQAYRKR